MTFACLTCHRLVIAHDGPNSRPLTGAYSVTAACSACHTIFRLDLIELRASPLKPEEIELRKNKTS